MNNKIKSEIKETIAKLKVDASPDQKGELKNLERLFGEVRQEFSQLKKHTQTVSEAESLMSEKLNNAQEGIAELERELAETVQLSASDAVNVKRDLEHVKKLYELAASCIERQVDLICNSQSARIKQSEKVVELIGDCDFENLKFHVAVIVCFTSVGEQIPLITGSSGFAFFYSLDQDLVVAMTHDEMRRHGENIDGYVSEIVNR